MQLAHSDGELASLAFGGPPVADYICRGLEVALFPTYSKVRLFLMLHPLL